MSPDPHPSITPLQIHFADVAVLPATPIGPAGPISGEFLLRRIGNVRDAGVWLRSAPYGRNTSRGAMAVFRDGVGTCTTKHAAIVTLAHEQGVELQLMWGLYALDDSVIAGAGAVLERAGVPFVPNFHCFVETDGHYVDLTEGNCTGKRCQIEDYLAVTAVDVGDSEEVAWRAAASDLCANDPRFGNLTVDELRDTLDSCVAANPVLCAREP